MRLLLLWGVLILQSFANTANEAVNADDMFSTSKLQWESDKVECLNSVDNNLESDLTIGIGNSFAVDVQKLKIRNLAVTATIQQTAPQEWSYMIGGTNPMDVAEIDFAIGMELSKYLNKDLENQGMFKKIADYVLGFVSNLRLRLRIRWWGSLTLHNDEVIHYASPSSVVRISPYYDSQSDIDDKVGAPEAKTVNSISSFFQRTMAYFSDNDSWGTKDDDHFDFGLSSLVSMGLNFVFPLDGMIDNIVQSLIQAAVEESMRNKAPTFLHACEIPFLCSEALDGKLDLSLKIDGKYRSKVARNSSSKTAGAFLQDLEAAEDRVAYESSMTVDGQAYTVEKEENDSSASFVETDPVDKILDDAKRQIDEAAKKMDGVKDMAERAKNATRIVDQKISDFEDSILSRWPDSNSPLRMGVGLKFSGALVGPGVIEDLKRTGLHHYLGDKIDLSEILAEFYKQTAHLVHLNGRGKVKDDQIIAEIGYPEAPYLGVNVPLWTVWTRSAGAGLGAPTKMEWFRSFFQQKGIAAASSAVIKNVRCKGIWWGLPVNPPNDRDCILFEQRAQVTDKTEPWMDVLQFNVFARAPGQYRVRVKYEAGSSTSFLVGTAADVAEIYLPETLSQMKAANGGKGFAQWEEEVSHWDKYRAYFTSSPARLETIDNPPADAPKPFVYPKTVLGAREVEISLRHGSNVVTMSALKPLGPGQGVRIHGITVEPVRGSADVERVLRRNPGGESTVGGFLFNIPMRADWVVNPIKNMLGASMSDSDLREEFVFTRILREWIHLRRLLGIHSQASIAPQSERHAMLKKVFGSSVKELFSTMGRDMETIDPDADDEAEFEQDRRDILDANNEEKKEQFRSLNKLRFLEYEIERPAVGDFLELFTPSFAMAKVRYTLNVLKGKANVIGLKVDHGAARFKLDGLLTNIFTPYLLPTDVVVDAHIGRDMTAKSSELGEYLDEGRIEFNTRQKRLYKKIKEIVTPEQEAMLKKYFPAKSKSPQVPKQAFIHGHMDSSSLSHNFVQMGDEEAAPVVSFAEVQAVTEKREKAITEYAGKIRARRRVGSQMISGVSPMEAEAMISELESLGLLVRSVPGTPDRTAKSSGLGDFYDNSTDLAGGWVAYRDGVHYPNTFDSAATSATSAYVAQPYKPAGQQLIERIRRGEISIDPYAFNGLSFRSQLEFMRTLSGVRIDEDDPFFMAPLPKDKELSPLIAKVLDQLDLKLDINGSRNHFRVQSARRDDVDARRIDAILDSLLPPNNTISRHLYDSYGPRQNLTEPLLITIPLRDLEEDMIGSKRTALDEKAKLAQMSHVYIPSQDPKLDGSNMPGAGFRTTLLDHYEGPLPFAFAAPAANWKLPLRGLLTDVSFDFGLNMQSIKRLPASPNPSMTVTTANRGAVNVEFNFMADVTISSQHKLMSLVSAMMTPSAKRLVRHRTFASFVDKATNEVRPVLVEIRCGRVTVIDISIASFGLAEALAASDAWSNLIADRAAVTTDGSMLKEADRLREDATSTSPAAELLTRIRQQQNLKAGSGSTADLWESLGLTDDLYALKLFIQAYEYLQSAPSESISETTLLTEAEDLIEEMIITSTLVNEKPHLFIPTSREEASAYIKERELSREALKKTIGILAMPPEVASFAIEELRATELPSVQYFSDEANGLPALAAIPVPNTGILSENTAGTLIFKPAAYHLFREGVLLQKRRLNNLMATTDGQHEAIKAELKKQEELDKAQAEAATKRKKKEEKNYVEEIKKKKKMLDNLFSFIEKK